jgi:hypothetical protein
VVGLIVNKDIIGVKSQKHQWWMMDWFSHCPFGRWMMTLKRTGLFIIRRKPSPTLLLLQVLGDSAVPVAGDSQPLVRCRCATSLRSASQRDSPPPLVESRQPTKNIIAIPT